MLRLVSSYRTKTAKGFVDELCRESVMVWGGLEARRFGIAFVDKKAESGQGYTGLVGRDRRGFGVCLAAIGEKLGCPANKNQASPSGTPTYPCTVKRCCDWCGCPCTCTR